MTYSRQQEQTDKLFSISFSKLHRPGQARGIQTQKRKPFRRQPLLTQHQPDAPITKTSAFKSQLDNMP
ncbi:MAG: hypothetical protein BGO85_18605 [Enterobacter sp. 56-7]|nr:MAG: hypothetical protein BGO85_18605 [Enterobacter sp. 56-7]